VNEEYEPVDLLEIHYLKNSAKEYLNIIQDCIDGR
jgi:hypothetical protein